MPTFYEFFAGGGLARTGLGDGWECLFANDIDTKKGASYEANWGRERLKIEDVGKLTTADLPDRADLAWASFPCQDLSVAGDCAGLKGERSGTFWPFWRLVEALVEEGRAPTMVVLENVCGALTSHGGKDFAAIGAALVGGGYRFGAMVMDAVWFVPQSRPRLFVVAVRKERTIPENLILPDDASPLWHPANLVSAYEKLSERSKDAWVWWNLPAPPARKLRFADVIEDDPQGVSWHTAAETERLLSLMSPINRKKVEQAMRMGKRMVGGIYKRTRKDDNGSRVQRAEIRFDDVSGCLRTPVGGSSRQIIMIVEGKKVRTRLLAPREAARLMGLPETYKLPANYNDAYHLAGDGVVVPVVRFLAAHLLEPLLAEGTENARTERPEMAGAQEQELAAFAAEKRFRGKGPLCVALVVTQHAKTMGLPLDPDKLLTEGGGQVLGLGKGAVQAVLKRHGITRVLADEGGRTSRGSLRNMREYVAFLNKLKDNGDVDLEAIETF